MIDAWWNSLGTALQLYYGIAIVTTFLLFLQLALALIGFDGDADADFEAADAPHDAGVSVLSVRSVTAFFAGFGWGGVVAIRGGLSLFGATAVALVTGGVHEARVKVAEKERDGAIGSANADRDQRIRVAGAGATAVEGENEAAIKVARSNANRREQEAEAERQAAAAEKVKTAQALEEAYAAEEQAERQRARREEATQSANTLVPAEIKKREIETLAEAEAERVRRTKKGEADGLRSLMEAEAEGLEAILSRKAAGFDQMVQAAQGRAEMAALLLVTEQMPKPVEEQVKAISNLKIDKVTVWEGGRGSGAAGPGGGKTATADFLAGLVGSLPPLQELTRNVGVKLPDYLGTMERADDGGEGGGGGRERRGGDGGGGEEDAGGDSEPPPAEAAEEQDAAGES